MNVNGRNSYLWQKWERDAGASLRDFISIPQGRCTSSPSQTRNPASRFPLKPFLLLSLCPECPSPPLLTHPLRLLQEATPHPYPNGKADPPRWGFLPVRPHGMRPVCRTGLSRVWQGCQWSEQRGLGQGTRVQVTRDSSGVALLFLVSRWQREGILGKTKGLPGAAPEGNWQVQPSQ